MQYFISKAVLLFAVAIWPVTGQDLQTLFSGIQSAHIRVNFFSFKTEETYTLTTFVDQQLSFSVHFKSTYDSWSGWDSSICQNY